MANPATLSQGAMTSTTSGALSPGWGAGHAANDIGLLYVATTSTTVPTLGTPAGFALLASSVGATGVRFYLYWCRATGAAQGAPTINTLAAPLCARIIVVRGCVTTGNPWEVATTTDTAGTLTTTYATPTGTTSSANSLVLAFVATRQGVATAPLSTGPTNASLTSLVVDNNSAQPAGANELGIILIEGLRLAVGSTGSSTGNKGVSAEDCSMTVSFPNQFVMSRTPLVGALTLAGKQTTIIRKDTITPGTATLVLSGKTIVPINPVIVPGTGVLTTTPIAPIDILVVNTYYKASARLGSPRARLGALQLAGMDAEVPATAQLALTGVAPTISVGLAPKVPNTGTLVLTGNAPTIIRQDTITPGTGALVLAGAAPVATRQDTITPAAGALALAGIAPVVTQGVGRVPTTGALVLSGNAPAITRQDTITPGAGSLVLAGVAPVLIQGAMRTPVAGALVLSSVAPVPTRGAVISPNTLVFTPVVSVADNFNRANGGLGAAFTSLDVVPLEIVNGQVREVNTPDGDDGIADYTGITWPNDQYSKIRIIAASANRGVYPIVRGNNTFFGAGTGSMYFAYCIGPLGAGAKLILAKFINHAYTELTPPGGVVVTLATNDILEIRAISSTISMWLNGVQQYSAVDTDLTSGYTGCAVADLGAVGNSSEAIFDDWEGGGFASLGITGIAPSVVQGAVCVPATGALTLAGVAPVVTRQTTIAPGTGALVLSGNAPSIPSTLPYITSFPLTQNPMSEGGVWVQGKTDGIDWNDVETASGNAIGTAFTPSSFADNIAHLNIAAITNDQYAEGTVHRASGYNPTQVHEIELLLRFQITANTARGYEILINSAGGADIVRWNGALGDFTPLPGITGPGISNPANGDVFRATIVGSTIVVTQNGSMKLTVTDATWATGKPGVGIFSRGADDVLASMGWSAFEAGNATSSPTPNTGALVLTGAAPAIVRQDTIRPGTGTLSLNGQLALLGGQLVVVPNTGALVLASAPPAATRQDTIRPGTGALTLASAAAAATRQDTITPATGALVLSGVAPVVTGLGTVQPSAGSLVLSGSAPIVTVLGPVQPAPAALVLTGRAPVVTLTAYILPPASPKATWRLHTRSAALPQHRETTMFVAGKPTLFIAPRRPATWVLSGARRWLNEHI